MSHAYHDSPEDIGKSWKRIHANGEETHIHLLSCGERYVVVAVDVDPRDFEAVAAEALAYCPTIESACERATAWMESNPKGVASESSGGSGFARKIVNGMKKLDQSANPDNNES